MFVLRIVPVLAAAVVAVSATPASAQFFFTSPDLRGDPVRGDEPDLGIRMPGATPAELRAGLVWSLRSALNVAALQCQFDETLLTVRNYNTILYNHKDELKKSFDTFSKYFTRTIKNPKAAITAQDQFGTRTYSGYTTVAAQFGFCQTAAIVARDAAYAKRGNLYKIAENRMRELHNSLIPVREMRFRRAAQFLDVRPALPRLDDACWTKKGDWKPKDCGPLIMALAT